MIIKKKQIRTLEPYKNILNKKEKFYIGVTDIERFQNILLKIGFTDKFDVGESVLPSASFGSICRFNAEGKYFIHKDKPMETAYRTMEWHWREWRGRYDSEEMSKFVDVPYKRYPRTFIPPPSVEITKVSTVKGKPLIVSPLLIFDPQVGNNVVHVINTFLEIFGEAQFFTQKLDNIIKSPLKKLNWRVLPPGPMPWKNLKTELEPLIKQAPEGNKVVIEYRLQSISKYKPDFVAVGEAGFWGYIIFGFKDKNVYICESPIYGNATYIFGKDWKTLSKMSKAEILRNDLQEERIIHRQDWESLLRRALKKTK